METGSKVVEMPHKRIIILGMLSDKVADEVRQSCAEKGVDVIAVIAQSGPLQIFQLDEMAQTETILRQVREAMEPLATPPVLDADHTYLYQLPGIPLSVVTFLRGRGVCNVADLVLYCNEVRHILLAGMAMPAYGQYQGLDYLTYKNLATELCAGNWVTPEICEQFLKSYELHGRPLPPKGGSGVPVAKTATNYTVQTTYDEIDARLTALEKNTHPPQDWTEFVHTVASAIKQLAQANGFIGIQATMEPYMKQVSEAPKAAAGEMRVVRVDEFYCYIERFGRSGVGKVMCLSDQLCFTDPDFDLEVTAKIGCFQFRVADHPGWEQ